MSKHDPDFTIKYRTECSIGQLTPTVCALGGVRAPRQCEAVPIEAVVSAAAKIIPEGRVGKFLIYNPDAVGDDLWRRYPKIMAPAISDGDIKLSCASVMPSVTPVCFASIYSGASPEVHGIRKYEKPALSVETLFDVFAGAGRKVAIVSRNECSIDRFSETATSIIFHSATTAARSS